MRVLGDVAITEAGRGLKVKEGSNARMGLATLSSGTVEFRLRGICTG